GEGAEYCFLAYLIRILRVRERVSCTLDWTPQPTTAGRSSFCGVECHVCHHAMIFEEEI
ncbi:unnamed protein product, partial [Sphacelaria rigidula]